MIWELKQKYYKADTPLPYVSKASHKADEERIKSLEAKIIKGGSDEERAVKAVAEAKEYLEQGHTLEELYRECIERGVCWEELFSCYIEHDPKCNDNIYVEVLWDP